MYLITEMSWSKIDFIGPVILLYLFICAKKYSVNVQTFLVLIPYLGDIVVDLIVLMGRLPSSFSLK